MEIIKEEVYAYLKLMTGDEIKDDTLFFDGVSIDGLDAEQMMIQIAEKYSVDLSEYDPANYHFNEAEITNFLLGISQAISGKSKKYASFTALHLYNVVKAGKWSSPTN